MKTVLTKLRILITNRKNPAPRWFQPELNLFPARRQGGRPGTTA